MTNRKKNVAIFAAGFLAGAVLASLVVGWNWRRVFEDSHSAAVAGQAHVAWMIYSGRSEELAESILSQLPTYISDIDRRLSRPPAHTLVDSWAASAYEASGQEMPQRVEEILDKWALARN